MVPLLYYIKLVHNFKSIGEFKLELQSGNAKFESKSVIFFCLASPWIWWKTLKNKRAPLLYYIKLCTSFQIHRWIQTGVTVRKRLRRVKIGIFVLCDLEIWRLTLKNSRAPLLCYFKLCASFHSHQWIHTAPELQSGNAQFGSKSTMWPWNLTDDIENNRAPLLSSIKLCASFHHHIWIQTGVTVRKRLNWFLTFVTLTFDLWPWTFAWISLLSLVIIHEISW